MKRRTKIIVLIISLVVFPVMACYMILAMYYRNVFYLNTWINGVYCTGKTVEEVNEELLSLIEAPILIISDKEGKNYSISLAEADYQMNYLTPLKECMKQQNSWLWIENAFSYRRHEIVPRVSYEEEKIKTLFEALEPVRAELQKKEGFSIGKSPEEGYVLYDFLSNRMDVELAFQALLMVIEENESELSLDKEEFYYDIPLTSEQKKLAEHWQRIAAFQQCDIVYDMGEDALDKLQLTSQIMAEFLQAENGLPLVDENGNLMLNENAVEEFVADIAEIYDTYGKERTFQSTRGDVITLSKGTYGTTINQKAEVEYLMENLLIPEMHTGQRKLHIPEYKREGFVRGRNDIGDTYIEVDMTEQKLYYYADSELALETDVVTGNTRRRMSTPEGINYVYNKQKNRILRGPGYASPVDFWMPVNKGIGIHDADWRSEFGGEIYKTNGSHGCINVPPEVMPKLYEMVEIGTPVIMFY